jgi:hypothetical protein
MNINYFKCLDKLNNAKSDIENLWEQAQLSNTKSFEDKQAYHLIENILESLDTAYYKLHRLSLPTIEGKLKEDTQTGKFELIENETGKGMGWQFSCGSYLEVFGDDGEWYPGRVEHTTRDGYKGYYFYNCELEHPFLYTGLRARTRRG